MSPAQVVLIAMTVAALVFTVLAYPHKYGALSGRSRLFRTVGICLFDLLFLLVTMGTFIDFKADVSVRIGLIRAAFYLASCYFLCFALICVALLDSLESISRLRRERRDELQKTLSLGIDAAREEARRNGKKGDDSSSSGDNKGA